MLIGQLGGIRREFPFPGAVPDPLILGPNPQKLESELARDGGDLVVGEDFAWIWDFDTAIEDGHGIRAPLPEPFASARLRSPDGARPARVGESRPTTALLEELIDNHHYSPDGMGFCRRARRPITPPTRAPGSRRDDADAERSFAVETGRPTFRRPTRTSRRPTRSASPRRWASTSDAARPSSERRQPRRRQGQG